MKLPKFSEEWYMKALELEEALEGHSGPLAMNPDFLEDTMTLKPLRIWQASKILDGSGWSLDCHYPRDWKRTCSVAIVYNREDAETIARLMNEEDQKDPRLVLIDKDNKPLTNQCGGWIQVLENTSIHTLCEVYPGVSHLERYNDVIEQGHKERDLMPGGSK